MVNRRKKAVQWVSTIQDIGRQLVGKKTARGLGKSLTNLATPASFAKGGRVKKTGQAKVHKGEVVLTKRTACALKSLLK